MPNAQGNRSKRHQTTRERIIDAAWRLGREQGLTGWTLRELARAVDMRAPSLYVYFDGKDAIYDAMYVQGYAALKARADAIAWPDDPVEALHLAAREWVEFAVEDPARLQLLFLRVIPGFEPSEESYATAQGILALLADLLSAVGITDPRALDLFTALTTGLATQQVSNDPGGDRWVRLVDDAVAMFLGAHGVGRTPHPSDARRANERPAVVM